MPAAEELDASPGASRNRGAVRAVGGLAHLDQPHAAGQLAREVHDDRVAVGQAAVDRGGDRRRGVHDERGRPATRKSAEVGEAGVHRRRRRPTADQQPHVVAPSPRASGGSCASCSASSAKSSGWVVSGRGHGCLGSAGATARVPGSAHSGASPVDRGRPGRARSRSGSGRSEMSSPGNASWCISVRMSPGSTTSTRSVGSLGREHPAGVLERGLRRAVAAPALVGLDRGVGRDVHDRARRRASVASSACDQRERRDHVHVEDRAQHVGVDARRAPAAGSRRACWRCSRRSSTGPSAPRPRRPARARCAGSVTSPATPTTSVSGAERRRPRRRAGRRRRASITSAQPRSASASASAQPESLRRSGDDRHRLAGVRVSVHGFLLGLELKNKLALVLYARAPSRDPAPLRGPVEQVPHGAEPA